MPKALEFGKKLRIVKLYLSGLGVNEIARKLSLSSSTVSELINDFNSGRFIVPESPDAGPLSEEIIELAKYCKSGGISLEDLPNLVSYGSLISDLEVDRDSLIQYLESLKKHDHPSAYLKNFEEVQAYLEENKLEFTQLLKMLKNSKNELQKTEKEIDTLNEKKGAIKNELKSIEDTRKDLQDTINQDEQTINTIKTYKDLTSAKSDEEIMALIQNLKDLEFDLHKINDIKRLSDTLQHNKLTVAKLMGFEEELEFLKNIGITKSAVSTLKIKTENGEKSIIDILPDYIQYLKTPEILEQNFNDAKAELEDEVDKFVASYKKENDEKIATLTEDYNRKKAEIEASYTQFEKETNQQKIKLNIELIDLRNQINKRKTDRDNIIQDIGVSKVFNNNLDKEKTALSNEIKLLGDGINLLEDKKKGVQEELKKYDEKKDKIDRELKEALKIKDDAYSRNTVLGNLEENIKIKTKHLKELKENEISRRLQNKREIVFITDTLTKIIKNSSINLKERNDFEKILGLPSFNTEEELRVYIVNQIIEHFSDNLGPYVSGYRILTKAEYKNFLDAKKELEELFQDYAQGMKNEKFSSLKIVLDQLLDQKYAPEISKFENIIRAQSLDNQISKLQDIAKTVVTTAMNFKAGANVSLANSGNISYQTLCPICKKVANITIKLSDLRDKDVLAVNCEQGHNFEIPSVEVFKGLTFSGTNMTLAYKRVFGGIHIVPVKAFTNNEKNP